MICQDREPTVILSPRAIGGNGALREVLCTLAHAETCARDMGCSSWEYATEIESLLGSGLKVSDLRWLVNKGYVSHAIEVTRPQDTARRFRSCNNLSFDRRTCFVLTEAGMALAADAASPPSDFPPGAPDSGLPRPSRQGTFSSAVPSWDGDRRILRMDGRIVKQYKVPSPNQEAILTAFAEEGWPSAIDDPLPPRFEQDPKHRLRKTLEGLNAHQVYSLLRFRGDGSGQRILWERVDEGLPQPVLNLRGRGNAA